MFLMKVFDIVSKNPAIQKIMENTPVIGPTLGIAKAGKRIPKDPSPISYL